MIFVVNRRTRLCYFAYKKNSASEEFTRKNTKKDWFLSIKYNLFNKNFEGIVRLFSEIYDILQKTTPVSNKSKLKVSGV